MPDVDLKAQYAKMLAAMNAKDFAAAEPFFTPDIVNRTPLPGEPPGVEGFRYRMGALAAGFPDFRFTTEDAVVEGDRIATRGVLTGTNTGPFMGLPPTGKPVRASYIDVIRCVDGKAAEHWVQLDVLGLMQQLGHAPA